MSSLMPYFHSGRGQIVEPIGFVFSNSLQMSPTLLRPKSCVREIRTTFRSGSSPGRLTHVSSLPDLVGT